MSWYKSILSRLVSSSAPSSEPVRAEMSSTLSGWVTSGLSAAGVAVTEETAMRVSSVYACVNLIGGAISSLPLPVYQRTSTGRERAQHDYWWMLNEQPCSEMSAAVFWEYMTGSLLLHGDAFARIERASAMSPKIVGLKPVHKSRVEVVHEEGSLWYRVWNDARTSVEVVHQDDMIHVPGAGFDGKTGMSQIKHALRQPAGIALAADEYSANFFRNGARPDFAIEVPGAVTAEQQDMIRSTWAERHGGLSNSHLPALMVGGAKVHELTMNAEDSQLIDTRRFQVEDIARIFGVPPHMIGHTSASTSWGTGIEQMSIGFVKYTLQRHLVKFEQEINRKFWPADTRYFAEFNTSGLERGDYKSRNEGYRIALGRAGEPGWMTVNEVRRMENLPPIDGGNTLSQASAQA